MKALVIGGTLFIGKRLVTRLLEEGHEVTVFHRQGTHGYGTEVGNLVGDRNDPESVRRAIGGQRFDWVFDNVYDWEHGTTAEQFAMVSAKNSFHGSLNPRAQFREEISVQQVLDARTIIEPLTLPMCSPEPIGLWARVRPSRCCRAFSAR